MTESYLRLYLWAFARERSGGRERRERERLTRKLGMRTNDVCIYMRKKNVWEREKTKSKGWCRWEWCDSWKKERMQIGLSSKMQAILAFACVRKREREREGGKTWSSNCVREKRRRKLHCRLSDARKMEADDVYIYYPVSQVRERKKLRIVWSSNGTQNKRKQKKKVITVIKFTYTCTSLRTKGKERKNG